jgi:hypothetical protein
MRVASRLYGRSGDLVFAITLSRNGVPAILCCAAVWLPGLPCQNARAIAVENDRSSDGDYRPARRHERMAKNQLDGPCRELD